MGKDDRARLRARQRMIARLLAGTAAQADAKAEAAVALARVEARVAWVDRTCADWRVATAAADAAWMALVAPYDDLGEDEDMPELDPPPEQAAVDRLWKQLDDVRRLDRWPRHLHWSV